MSSMFSNWHLIPVEGDDYASSVLKLTCGIDYLLICEETPNVYGVASHIQSGKNYRTFTVPKRRVNRIEYDKKLRPYYTMQVYLSGGKIIGLGLIKTEDLIEFIECGLAEANGKYYVCKWDALREAEYDVMEYRAEPVAEDTAKKEASQKHFRVYKNGQEYEDEEAMRELAKNVGLTYDEVSEMIEEFFNDTEDED